MSAQVKIGRAAVTPENLATVVRFRRDAAAWLAAQGQDQWVSDWPDTDTMLAGFERDLEAGATWFAETADPDPRRWRGKKHDDATVVRLTTANLTKGVPPRVIGCH